MSVDLEQQLTAWADEAKSVGAMPRTPHFSDPAAPQRNRRRVVSASLAAAAIAVTGVVVGVVVNLGVDGGGKQGVQTLSGETPTPTPEPTTLVSPVPQKSEVVTPLGSKTDISDSGTKLVDFGVPPATANTIVLGFTCLTPGTFSFPGGTGLTCSAQDLQRPDVSRTITFHLPVTTGRQTTTVTAASEMRWHLTATYANDKPAKWGINASGQTYGMVDETGTPDLVLVVATNGKDGYAYASQLQATTASSPSKALTEQQNQKPKTIPVYESDGKTVIGEFHLS